ncbi:MAG: hypothetical protein IJ089_10090 [Clostridia bacterium]|nr:hypothetical protein [Clostridia bacterium]
MAYNNIFPMGYQPAYYPQQQQQYQMQTPVQQPQQNSSIIWVQGEAGAKSYLVAPNSTVQLWDSEKQTIYLKSADASGMPSMKTLDYTIRDLSPANAPVGPSTDGVDSRIRQEIQGLQRRLEALEMAIKPNVKMEVQNDEQSAV